MATVLDDDDDNDNDGVESRPTAGTGFITIRGRGQRTILLSETTIAHLSCSAVIIFSKILNPKHPHTLSHTHTVR